METMLEADNQTWVVETPRLGFRQLCREDHQALQPILGDIETMYAWEYGFSDQQITQWIDRSIERYAKEGCGYHAAIDKASGQLVGMMGCLREDIEGTVYLGVGYIVGKKHWGKGYAVEGARAWVDYAYAVLGAEQVIADIRPSNPASRRVAEQLGMTVIGEYVKQVNGRSMPHLVYACSKEGRGSR